MISGVSHGAGFRGAISYVVEKDDAEVLDISGVMCTKTAAAEMRAIAAQSEKVESPVYHRWFRLAKGERLTDEQWITTVGRAEKALGLEGHQRVVVRHRDTDGDHVHVVWNRVNPETHRAVRMSHDYAKTEQVCRWSELEFGLQQVPGNHSGKQVRTTRDATSGEVQEEARSGREPFARIVAEAGNTAFDQARSWEDLAERLQRAGLRLEPYRQGLVVTDGTERVGLSKATGNQWTRSKLEKRFSQTWTEFQQAPSLNGKWGHLLGEDEPLRSQQQTQERQGAERLRRAYQDYREQFRQSARQNQSHRRDDAWRREQAKRAEAAAVRREVARRQKALARLVCGRGIARRITCSLIDRRIRKRAQAEYAQASERWEAAKAETPPAKPLDFAGWLADRARAGDEDARRHQERMRPAKANIITMTEAPARPSVAEEMFDSPTPISAKSPATPLAEPVRPQPQTDGEIEAEWKRLVDARTNELRERGLKLLATARAEWLASDDKLEGINRNKPEEPTGFSAVLWGSKYEKEMESWRKERDKADKERMDKVEALHKLKICLGVDGEYDPRVLSVREIAQKEIREENPALAARSDEARARREAQQQKEYEDRRRSSLDRFQKKLGHERGNGHGRGR